MNFDELAEFRLTIGLARHSGTFLLDAGVAKQRAEKSSALAECA